MKGEWAKGFYLVLYTIALRTFLLSPLNIFCACIEGCMYRGVHVSRGACIDGCMYRGVHVSRGACVERWIHKRVLSASLHNSTFTPRYNSKITRVHLSGSILTGLCFMASTRSMQVIVEMFILQIIGRGKSRLWNYCIVFNGSQITINQYLITY